MLVTNENLQTIRRRWPDIHAMLSIAKYSPEDVSFSNTPSPSLVFKGIQINSGYDRNREAQIQASIIPKNANHATVYGFGSGELYQLLLQRPSIEKLTVMVLDVPLTKACLQTGPLQKWLLDERVELKYGGGEISLRTPFTALPSCLVLADQQSSRIRDMVNLELATPYINQQHAAQEQHLLTTRFKENAPLIKGDLDVAELFASRTDQIICIAAAGPTLTDTMPLLKKLGDTTTVIALDASLQSLINNDILPDFTISQDAHPTTIHKFLNIDNSKLEKTSLVYFPTVDNKALQAWKGPRYVAYSTGRLYRNLMKTNPRGTLFSAGSVLHAGVDLAVKMGGRRLLLFGADFGYPHGMSHAEGSAARKKVVRPHTSLTVLNGNNEQIQSIHNLVGYLRDLEHYISMHPEVSFLNTSREGARINGCDYFQVDSL